MVVRIAAFLFSLTAIANACAFFGLNSKPTIKDNFCFRAETSRLRLIDVRRNKINTEMPNGKNQLASPNEKL